MPRRDRKRHDPDLEQFVALANMLPATGDGRSSSSVLDPEPAEVAELERRFVAGFPATTDEVIREQLATGRAALYVLPPPAPIPPGTKYDPNARVPKRLARAAARRWEQPIGLLRIRGRALVIYDRDALYRLAYYVRQTLLTIIASARDASFPGAQVRLPMPESRTIVIVPGRPMELRPDPYVDAFVQTLLATHPDRIRQCPVETCRRLYIALRGHSGACSKPCQNVMRNRRLRARQKRDADQLAEQLNLAPESVDTEPVLTRRAKRRAKRAKPSAR